MRFKKAVIVGPGFMGSSLARDLKAKKISGLLWAVTRNQKRIAEIQKHRIFDRVTNDVESACRGADLIVLATPVETILKTLPKLKTCLSSDAVVFDIGSTKRAIMQMAQKCIPDNFVGTHPLCGSEKKGIIHSQKGIFEGMVCILTPLANNDVFTKVAGLWRSLGAKVELLSAEEHDAILAYTSHLPHLLAFALMECVPREYLRYTAGSFRDMVRVAASDAHVWEPILHLNRDYLKKTTNRFYKSFQKLAQYVLSQNRKQTLLLLQRIAQKKGNFSKNDDYRY